MFHKAAFRSKFGAGFALTIGALTLTGCATAPAQPTPVWLGQLSPTAPLVHTRVSDWKALKFTNLVRQQADFSCGAAVMATIFNYAYGHETTERQVLVNMLKVADPDIVRAKGFSLLDMKTYAESIGMAAEGYRLDYATLADLNIPTIVLLNIRGYKHFVIVRKIFGDQVAIGDPALGNRTMTRRQFEDGWNGIAFVVTGEGYDPRNVLLDPPSPLSARALLATSASLPAAQAAEFGYATGYDFSF